MLACQDPEHGASGKKGGASGVGAWRAGNGVWGWVLMSAGAGADIDAVGAGGGARLVAALREHAAMSASGAPLLVD